MFVLYNVKFHVVCMCTWKGTLYQTSRKQELKSTPSSGEKSPKIIHFNLFFPCPIFMEPKSLYKDGIHPRKLSILVVSWQKPCARILYSLLHFLRAMNVISCVKLNCMEKFLWEDKKTTFKSFKFHKNN